MHNKINETRNQFQHDLAKASTTALLEELRVKYLGKKGPIQELMKSLREVAPESRPEAGKQINDLKEEIACVLTEKQTILTAEEEAHKLESEKIDVSLPGQRRFIGRKHVINQVLDQMIDILIGMGFSVQYGPDVDTDYNNFESLNFPPDHPARDMQDTFYITSNVLLRTQTSNVQNRIMVLNKPPIRIISPGKVYRNEAITARSHVFFHQLEAVYIDKKVSFADLLSTLKEFLNKLFKQNVETRFRPSYFPFVEPGMEVDVSCISCNGKGCNLCKYTGWLEVAGAGMVHPEVLKNGGIDPEEYSGFAWGLGAERLAMMIYGIKDIRLFTENDLRFLSQFSAV